MLPLFMRNSAIIFILVVFGLPVFSEEFERLPWTASRLSGSPDPGTPYLAEPVFTEIAFNQGLELLSHDGRFYVVGRGGKILSFSETPDGKGQTDLFLDLKVLHPDLSNAYGLAFHPDWRKNRQVFVTYTIGNEIADGSKLSRFTFTFTGADPPKVELESEEVLLTWVSGGHNGANLQFGPDGMLYLSTGDATAPSPPDILNTGQDNSDLLSAILRIDIDGADEGLKYRIPADNPYVGRENVRPEVWSFGFRNPWKMSFDERGRLWVGDVGWELWEMIHLVGRGTNHGWSAVEASQPIKPGTASDLAPIIAPVAAHPHSEAASITGGFVYHGKRLPELAGAYVYGDYETGKIWALWHDGERLTRHQEIADTPHRISTFGVGSDGELYYLHYGDPATMHRLVANPKAGQLSDFPRLLSETGLFSDLAARVPHDGVYEYRIQEPMWQDGADATRYLALPNTTSIATTIANRRATVTWPADAVLAKTIRLGERPVETQVLHYDGETWNAYAYRWNAAGSEATLADAAGEEFDVPEAGWKGGTRYRIHSRAECMRCHNMWNEFVAGFQPAQLAEFPAFPGHPAREAAVALGMTNASYFERDAGGKLISSRGPGSVETRARSWLHANCAHCHRRHGGGSAPLEVNFDRTLSDAALLWQNPTRGNFGLTEARAIVPGEPSRSVLNYRVSTVGSGHMPPLGSREIDEKGVALLWEWVASLPREAAIESEPVTTFTPALLADTSSAMRLAHAAASDTLAEGDRASSITAGLASPQPEIRALFERFRPVAERPLPRRHDPSSILKLTGDPENGSRLLSPAGKLGACFACHRLGNDGLDFGPDLSEVGSRLDPGKLLESLIDPSKVIVPEFQLWTVETTGGEILSGFLLERTDEKLTLQSGPGMVRSITAPEVKSSRPQPLSAMPGGLLDFLTTQEAADVVAWLTTRKAA